MNLALLDTDILSELLKQRNSLVTSRAFSCLQQFGEYCISGVTKFEFVRGCIEAKKSVQITRFQVFCTHSLILSVDEVIFDRAAELWVLARQWGHPHGDADILIAATALEHGRELVTGNTQHFAWIPGLILADWRLP